MFETVSELIKAFREDEKDSVSPGFFWSNSQLVRFVNGSLIAFAERARCVIDVIPVELSAGEHEVDYPHYIIDVLSAVAEIEGRERRVEIVAAHSVVKGRGLGFPRSLVLNERDGRSAVYPAPIANGALTMRVARRPIKPVELDSKIPDVPMAYRESLLLYLKHRAYNVKDAEIFDGAKSELYLAEFEAECRRAYVAELLRRSEAKRIAYRG